MKNLIDAIKKVLSNVMEIKMKYEGKESTEIYTPVSAASSKNVR